MAAVVKRLKSVFNPDMYHGWGKNRCYFEGWYYKLVNAEADKIFAVIPGISIDSDGSKHAFIQILDGIKAEAEYFKFDFDRFSPGKGEFKIAIADNLFTKNYIILNLPDITCKLEFTGLSSWPNKWYSPGIMGPFTFVPFMECYHGIISMNHMLTGKLSLKSEIIDFTGGRGYTEKDWGRSFPLAYLWLQSNHFEESGTSIKLSVARIPWIGRSFNGFIAGLLHKGKLYEFTTYNSSKIEHLDILSDKVDVQIANKKFRLSLSVKREKATLLASPVSGKMSGHISESIRSEIRITLIDIISGNTVYRGLGKTTALEVAGDIDMLISNFVDIKSLPK